MILNAISKNAFANMFVKNGSQGNSAQKSANSTDKTSLRKMEYQQRNSSKQSSVVDQSLSYAKQLSASRAKSKDNSLQKKKLQYSFKKISSQIIRSKNSVSARKAVQAAKREIMRLKRLKAGGEYDEEELQLAIDHAKAMEKVAKKKVSHLEQEEMIERGGKGVASLEEELKTDEQETEETPEEELEEIPEDEELLEEELAGASYGDEYYLDPDVIAYEYSDEDLIDMMTESMSDLLDEFSDEMMDMMEELDLTDLAESMYAPDPNMSEDDLKMLKIKHRYKELKEIAQADKEYLKGMMEHEKSKAEAGMPVNNGVSAQSLGIDPSPKVHPVISMPGEVGGAKVTAPVISGGFDVSV